MSSVSKLDAWVERIQDKDMPVFGQTVQNILKITENKESAAAELANAILQDATMTTRILKLVNTSYYNKRASRINTVSRAVVLLGFDSVRALCLSIALVDSLVHGKNRDRLHKILAFSIHAAIQARSIALQRNSLAAEEIFIATLLHKVGDIVFWCFSDEAEGSALDKKLRQPNMSEESAQVAVLGFKMEQLTARLIKAWHLNSLLNDVINRDTNSEHGQNINLALQLASAVEQHGWHTTATKEAVQNIQKFIGNPSLDATVELLHQDVREAVRISILYGSNQVAQIIPLPDDTALLHDDNNEIARYPEPDSQLQLNILRELSSVLVKGTEINLIIELVLEGIFRGVGMDRTLLALINQHRRGVRAKFALGENSDQLMKGFNFQRTAPDDLLYDLIENQNTHWITSQKRKQMVGKLPIGFDKVVGSAPFFIAPVAIHGKSFGVIYADRALSQRELDEESYSGFRHFVLQVNMGLSLISPKR